jgi:hypothetical protein
MMLRLAAIAVLSGVTFAQAEPVVIASGAYPEGLLWHGGRLYLAELGADRISIVEEGGTREFWRMNGCGPTQIVPFGPKGFVVNCHLGRAMIEVSASGQTGRRFATNRAGERLQDPNAAASDGHGGAYFSDSGVFDNHAPPTGRVYHLSANGTMSEVVSGLRYAPARAVNRTEGRPRSMRHCFQGRGSHSFWGIRTTAPSNGGLRFWNEPPAKRLPLPSQVTVSTKGIDTLTVLRCRPSRSNTCTRPSPYSATAIRPGRSAMPSGPAKR